MKQVPASEPSDITETEGPEETGRIWSLWTCVPMMSPHDYWVA